MEQNGRILRWGSNEYGHLDVPRIFYRYYISDLFACAIDTNNKVHCWGGDDDDQYYDVQGDFQEVAIGNSFGCGFTLSNELKCWNDDEELSVDTDEDGLSLLVDCDDNDASMNEDDADGDGYSTCGGDFYDDDAELNLDDADGDGVFLDGTVTITILQLFPLTSWRWVFWQGDNDCDDSTICPSLWY